MSGRGIGRRGSSSALMLVGVMIFAAPSAAAHGEAAAAPVILEKAAGPYVVSLWIDEYANGSVVGHAVVEAGLDQRQPRILLQTSQGRAALDGLIGHGEGTWTMEFAAQAGDAFVITWAMPSGGSELVIPLEAISAPWWVRLVLAVVTFPGLWFGFWLMNRRRRAFGLTPSLA